MANKRMREVENVNVPGRVSRVNADKYEAMRLALRNVLPQESPGLTQAEMKSTVLPHLPQDLWPGGAKSMWWLKTVQLDLEAKGLITRTHDGQITRWQRAADSTAGWDA